VARRGTNVRFSWRRTHRSILLSAGISGARRGSRRAAHCSSDRIYVDAKRVESRVAEHAGSLNSTAAIERRNFRASRRSTTRNANSARFSASRSGCEVLGTMAVPRWMPQRTHLGPLTCQAAEPSARSPPLGWRPIVGRSPCSRTGTTMPQKARSRDGNAAASRQNAAVPPA